MERRPSTILKSDSRGHGELKGLPAPSLLIKEEDVAASGSVVRSIPVFPWISSSLQGSGLLVIRDPWIRRSGPDAIVCAWLRAYITLLVHVQHSLLFLLRSFLVRVRDSSCVEHLGTSGLKQKFFFGFCLLFCCSCITYTRKNLPRCTNRAMTFDRDAENVRLTERRLESARLDSRFRRPKVADSH
jgi:hypothetical protein